MSTLNYRKGYSIITATVKKGIAEKVINHKLSKYCENIVIMKARGTLLREEWYQKFLPSIQPEEEILEILIKDMNVENMISKLVDELELFHSGSGNIYSTPCVSAKFLQDARPEIETMTEVSTSYKMQENLIAIYCVVQKGKANEITKSIMNIGAPGQTVAYGKGIGIRDRLGLLKIAINPEKEIIYGLIEEYEVERIFETMIDVGHLGVAGAGFIYMVPVQKGIINAGSVISTGAHLASLPQMIKAIDDLTGSHDWRTKDLVESDSNKKVIHKKRKYLENFVRVTCIAERDATDPLIQAALAAGAPAASTTFGKELGRDDLISDSAIKLSREKEIIRLVIPPDRVDTIIEAISATAKTMNYNNVIFYTNSVTKAFTFLK